MERPPLGSSVPSPTIPASNPSIRYAGPVPTPDGLCLDVSEAGDVLRWSIRNETGSELAVDRAQLRFTVDPHAPMFRNGYQSWSFAGEDGPDPSTGGAPGVVRAMHHADPTVVVADERRSELATMVGDTAIGFAGGDRHDGTFRRRGAELLAEAYLGGAILQPGEVRQLHDVRVGGSLDEWATWCGRESGARVDAPYQVGWCSWYHYFHDVTERDLRENLALAGDWPFDVFQLDDGYQAAIGDWLLPNERFPSGIERVAGDIASAGLSPGIWIAPFLVSPASAATRRHPEWLLTRPSGRPAVGMVNDGWGGATWVLDTTRPDVLTHLEDLARDLVAMGWRYLKLDFTYAPALDGNWHDRSLTPAQRVRQAYDAIRRGAGDAFVLGCGAPLGPCIGVVDGMRIGPDVAPYWEPHQGWPGYADTIPSTANALRNTVARQFMHRRLWLNDPDCVMLRTSATELSHAQITEWALAVAHSGGMAIVSDDLSLVDAAGRRLFDDVLAVGRAADDRYR